MSTTHTAHGRHSEATTRAARERDAGNGTRGPTTNGGPQPQTAARVASSPKQRRATLSAEQKAIIYREVAQGMAISAAAAAYGVDRSTVTRILRIGKSAIAQAMAASRPGRPARTPDATLSAARARIDALASVAAHQAVEMHLRRGRAGLGLRGGVVPPRVDAATKEGLLALVDEAIAAGWSQTDICRVLGLDVTRLWRWRKRAALGRLDDTPRKAAGTGLTEREEREVLALIEEWGTHDRSVRTLAHRGSHEGRVWVSPSTVQRVLHKHELSLPPALHVPPMRVASPPAQARWEPDRFWAHDVARLPGSGQVAAIIVDVVSHAWLATAVHPEDLTVAVHEAAARAMAIQHCTLTIVPTAVKPLLPGRSALRPIAEAATGSERGVGGTSDGSGRAREVFLLASSRIIAMFGPDPGGGAGTQGASGGELTSSVYVPSPLGYLSRTGHAAQQLTDPGEVADALEQARHAYNTRRLDPSLGYVTPADVHSGRAEEVRAARREGLERARRARARVASE